MLAPLLFCGHNQTIDSSGLPLCPIESYGLLLDSQLNWRRLISVRWTVLFIMMDICWQSNLIRNRRFLITVFNMFAFHIDNILDDLSTRIKNGHELVFSSDATTSIGKEKMFWHFVSINFFFIGQLFRDCWQIILFRFLSKEITSKARVSLLPWLFLSIWNWMSKGNRTTRSEKLNNVTAAPTLLTFFFNKSLLVPKILVRKFQIPPTFRISFKRLDKIEMIKFQMKNQLCYLAKKKQNKTNCRVLKCVQSSCRVRMNVTRTSRSVPRETTESTTDATTVLVLPRRPCVCVCVNALNWIGKEETFGVELLPAEKKGEKKN